MSVQSPATAMAPLPTTSQVPSASSNLPTTARQAPESTIDIDAIQKLSISQGQRRDKQTPMYTEAEEEEKRQQIVRTIRHDFLHNPKPNLDIKNNFFRLLTSDQCSQRHYSLEPKILNYFYPLDNDSHDLDQDAILANTLSLGNWDRLPLEILQQILSEATLSTLTTCRSVSRGFRLAVDNVPQYKDIITFAPSSLRAAIGIEVAPYITCIDLHNVLCRKECETCGKFGAFLYLLRCERVCYECFTSHDNFLTLTPRHAMQKTATKPKDFKKHDIPTARCLPGQYDKANNRKREHGRTQLVDMNSAIAISSIVHGSASRAKELADAQKQERNGNWINKMADWDEITESGAHARAPSRPPFYQYRDAHENNPHRYMCIVGIPWLDRPHGTTEWGVACKGCSKLSVLRDSYYLHHLLSAQDVIDMDAAAKKERVLYSEEEYIEHFTHCQLALELLAQNKDELLGPAILLCPLWMCKIAGDKTAADPSFLAKDGSLLPIFRAGWTPCMG